MKDGVQGPGETLVMETFITLMIVMVSQMYTYVKTHQVEHFQYMQFLYVKLYTTEVVQ